MWEFVWTDCKHFEHLLDLINYSYFFFTQLTLILMISWRLVALALETAGLEESRVECWGNHFFALLCFQESLRSLAEPDHEHFFGGKSVKRVREAGYKVLAAFDSLHLSLPYDGVFRPQNQAQRATSHHTCHDLSCNIQPSILPTGPTWARCLFRVLEHNDVTRGLDSIELVSCLWLPHCVCLMNIDEHWWTLEQTNISEQVWITMVAKCSEW